ncbi:MAG: hypothetical protein JWR75_223 [Devosia sp.]|nr:hypothetical protein [Devosia sp.]
MRSLVVSVVVLLTISSSTAFAHHKPGHSIPPGQMKKSGPVLILESPPAAELVAVQPEAPWGRYIDPQFAFAIDLPTGLFEQVDRSAGAGVKLQEIGGGGQIEVFGWANLDKQSPAELLDALEQAQRLGEVTYRAHGNSWFVLSGYFTADDAPDEPLVFYTKVMFSADRSRISAFEISYPAAELERFDPIVTRLSRTLTSPR